MALDGPALTGADITDACAIIIVGKNRPQVEIVGLSAICRKDPRALDNVISELGLRWLFHLSYAKIRCA